MDDLPVGLARFVVGDTLAMEQFRGLGEHTARDGCCRLPRQSMTYCAVVFVELSSGKIIRLVGGDGHGLRHLAIQDRVQSLLGQDFSIGIGGASVATGALPDKK